MFPLAIFVANLLARRTNGEQAAEHVHLAERFLQLTDEFLALKLGFLSFGNFRLGFIPEHGAISRAIWLRRQINPPQISCRGSSSHFHAEHALVAGRASLF